MYMQMACDWTTALFMHGTSSLRMGVTAYILKTLTADKLMTYCRRQEHCC